MHATAGTDAGQRHAIAFATFKAEERPELLKIGVGAARGREHRPRPRHGRPSGEGVSNPLNQRARWACGTMERVRVCARPPPPEILAASRRHLRLSSVAACAANGRQPRPGVVAPSFRSKTLT